MAGGYPVEAAANALLRDAGTRGIKLTPMKLQKLLYLAHGYYMAVTSTPLIDEDFEAWEYGPVSPTVYHALKRYGGGYIEPSERLSRLVSGRSGFDFQKPQLGSDDPQAANIIDYVLNTYGARTGIYLSELTHKVGSPWETTRTKDPQKRNAKIDNELIKSYFTKLVNNP